jgi:TonB family protein
VIAGKLSLQAREQIDAGNFDMAEALLADVRRIDPSSPELTASANALTAARDREAEIARRAEEQRIAAERAAQQKAAAEKAAAEQKAADEKAAAERQAAAERAAAEQKAAAEKAAADKAAADRALAARLAAEKLAADQVPAATPVAPVNVPATTTAVEEPVTQKPVARQARIEEPAAEAPQQEVAAVVTRLEAPVPVSSLSRTKYVAPRYPRAAQRRGLTGWVDVVLTVDIDGTVTDILVRDSEPEDTFVSAATSAVEKWEFEPVIENGVAVQKRAAVRMMFAME